MNTVHAAPPNKIRKQSNGSRCKVASARITPPNTTVAPETTHSTDNLLRALQHHRPNYRTHSEKPEQQSVTERTLHQPSCHCGEQRPKRAREEDHAGRAEQQLLNVFRDQL